jgi:hypothetical protein
MLPISRKSSGRTLDVRRVYGVGSTRLATANPRAHAPPFRETRNEGLVQPGVATTHDAAFL